MYGTERTLKTVGRYTILAAGLLCLTIAAGCARPSGSVTGTLQACNCQVMGNGSLAVFLTLHENPTNMYFVSSRVGIKGGVLRDAGGGNVQIAGEEGWKVQIDYRPRKGTDGSVTAVEYDVVRLKRLKE